MGYTRNVEIVALALEGRLVTVECHLDSNGLTGRGKENERKGQALALGKSRKRGK